MEWKVMLYANYNLLGLLPKELRLAFPKRVEYVKGGTAELTFDDERSRSHFMSLCNQYQLQYRSI